MSKDPIEVAEPITTLMKPTDKKDVKEFIKELDDLYNKHCHSIYDHFSVALVVKGQDVQLNYVGYRKETADETKARVAVEEEKRKRSEAAELKEYLRLKKIYGKKGEE